MDRTGLFGLFSLDGAPPDPVMARALGLAMHAAATDHIAAACDLADPGAAQALLDDGALTLFLGRLEVRDDLAVALGLSTDLADVALAAAALDRYGADIRTRLDGEWMLARWNGDHLILATSICLRDPLFYALRNDCIAISSDLRQLSRIAWVGDTFDPAGLLMAMGRAGLRGPDDCRTPVTGVSTLRPGAFVTIGRRGAHVAPPAIVQVEADWRGDINAAMAQVETLLLAIVRERMVGGRYACMLSGGLDSSLLAWATAHALRADETLYFLTSAAATGSKQLDEMAEAAMVATHLGKPHVPVHTAATPGPYCPDPLLFRDSNGPGLDIRHYLYHQFAERTLAGGTSVLFDGQFGELTLTNPFPLRANPSPLQAMRMALRARWPSATSAAESFHVLLAPHLLAAPPEPLATALRHNLDGNANQLPAPNDSWGIRPGFAKAARAPASIALGRVRVAMPFRDPRLIALVAALPAAMLYPRTGERTPARTLLSGKLPDTIRLRGKGPGFAPDYLDRLRQDAAAARTRVPLYRRAGADEWLDLDALDRGLGRAAGGSSASYADATRTQLTAIAAEFIAWWRGIS